MRKSEASEVLAHRKPFVISIAAVSGGGKTAVTNRLHELLQGSAQLSFDDYDFKGPVDICDWVERGADYREWDVTPMADDVATLIATNRLDYILLDYPFAYLHDGMREYIDFSIFIDTPLDIAMARRLLRDFADSSIDCVTQDLSWYLSRARNAYLHMLSSTKPASDWIVDGSLPLEVIVKEIREKIETRRRHADI